MLWSETSRRIYPVGHSLGPISTVFSRGRRVLDCCSWLAVAARRTSPCGAIFRRVWAVGAIRRSVLHLFPNFLGDGGLFCLFLAGQTSSAAGYLLDVRSSVVRARPDVRPSSLP